MTIERASRVSDEGDNEFPFEKEAKAYARTQFAKGGSVRVDTSDGSLTVTPAQIPAWLLGSPRDVWPADE